MPPTQLKNKKDKYITAMMVPEMVTAEMKEAYLGNSRGIQSKLDYTLMNQELGELFEKQLTKPLKKSYSPSPSRRSEVQTELRVKEETDRLSSSPDPPPPASLEVMSSLAKSLLKNSMTNRAEQQDQMKILRQKQRNQEVAGHQDFSKQFPVFYDLL